MYRSVVDARAARAKLPRRRRRLIGISSLLAHPQIQPDENAFGVREIPDDLLDRFGETPVERRDRQDLIALGQLRVLQEIDDLDLIVPVQMFLTDLLQVSEGKNRLRSLARYVES